MKTESQKVVLEGKLKRNIFGDWDDVDKGFYIDGDEVESVLYDFLKKNVRITIEEIPEENKDESNSQEYKS